VQLDLHGPAGRLEALLEVPPSGATPRFAALVCHPHPQYGGTMHNHATYRLARAVRASGGVSLRFNFRGVGRSAGAYDRGRGEAEDAKAALAHLASVHPELPRLACGFSFGSWMALLAGEADPAVRGFLLAGFALSSADLDVARDTAPIRATERPVAIVQAARDEFGTPEEVGAVVAGSRGPRRIVAIPGASHLFGEDLPGLEREAVAALEWLLTSRA
jgi:alpha/beta superfamily hydrolase